MKIKKTLFTTEIEFSISELRDLLDLPDFTLFVSISDFLINFLK